jgi:hypothetical protein
MLQPFDAYRFYNALKLHFGGNYDAIKYQYKTSANQKSFWKRKDKYFFAKVAKRFTDQRELVNYYVAHFIKGNTWVGNMISDDETYTSWLKQMESLGYNFEQDLYKLEDAVSSFDELFTIGDEQYPPLIQMYMSEDIALETVVIIDQLTGCVNRLDKSITETIVWPDVKTKIQKYSPFVNIDRDKMKKIILKVFTS